MFTRKEAKRARRQLERATVKQRRLFVRLVRVTSRDLAGAIRSGGMTQASRLSDHLSVVAEENMREWERLERALENARRLEDELPRKNPPPFVARDASSKRLWNKAKRAALEAGVDNPYAYAAHWYRDRGGRMRG